MCTYHITLSTRDTARLAVDSIDHFCGGEVVPAVDYSVEGVRSAIICTASPPSEVSAVIAISPISVKLYIKKELGDGHY